MLLENERKEIIVYGKKMITDGLTRGTGGNISICDAEQKLMAITPSGIDYFKLTPEDIVIIDVETGKIVDVKIVDNETEVMLITSEGTLIRTRVDSISVIGRSTSGVRIMKVRNNEKVASTVKITSESELEENSK